MYKAYDSHAGLNMDKIQHKTRFVSTELHTTEILFVPKMYLPISFLLKE